MASLPSFILLFLCSILVFGVADTIGHKVRCERTSCVKGGISIEFPFWLREGNETPNPWCGYPGFELSCTNTTGFSEPLVNLPGTGDFSVKFLSLEDQVVWINDPDECLANRIMRNRGLNLQGSPFKLSSDYNVLNFSFLSCPSNLSAFSLVQPITCLESMRFDHHHNKKSNDNVNYSVVAVLSDPPFPVPWTAPCEVISWALIPVMGMSMTWLLWNDYESDIKLEWANPNCGSCAARGGRCGFLEPRFGDTSFHVGCYHTPTHVQGISRKVKYLGIGLGISGLLCIIGLTYFLYDKKQISELHEQQQLQSRATTMSGGGGGDLFTMNARGDFYTLVSAARPNPGGAESKRLPKHNDNDNVCAICLCEYKAKEILRAIPGCNHYFHALCIDGWLKMNPSCPLCRMLLTHTTLPFNPPYPTYPPTP